jgi:hypothetical protein
MLYSSWNANNIEDFVYIFLISSSSLFPDQGSETYNLYTLYSPKAERKLTISAEEFSF